MCSSTGAAIERIAAAIDELASDALEARGAAASGDLTTRVAALWQMMGELDPEVARRARRYTGAGE